ncbi:MAG: hypothetical protein H6633_30355 [Anaerolineales bacterium]|nr:hypothetical protein [Anaerolineales bacterium]
MSKQKKRRNTAPPPSPQRPWWIWVVAAAGVIALVGGLAFLLSSNRSGLEEGTPQIVVDSTTIDEGYQKLDTPVRTSFTLRNEGDAPLRILGEPQVELVEGC